MNTPLLSARGLSKWFPVSGPLFRPGTRFTAVDDVSLHVNHAQTLALVGESGSGKTTTARLILRLIAADSGSVLFDGLDWFSLPRARLNEARKLLGVVFQDPATSLNPRMPIGDIVAEPLAIHKMGSRAERRLRAAELLESVGLGGISLAKRPGDFSGGQRQRIAIARALSTRPKLIVLDEPVSALDSSVRGQILNLLMDLQESPATRAAYLFIGHDLGVVRAFADTVSVMYMGRIVESGNTEAVLSRPLHPYTALLLSSEPGTARAREGGSVTEVVASKERPGGCAFHPRCPRAAARCREEVPLLAEQGEDPGRSAACFFPLPP